MTTFLLKRVLIVSGFVSLVSLLLLHGRNVQAIPIAQDGNQPADDQGLTDLMKWQLENRAPAPANVTPQEASPCVNGMAGIFPCNQVDLLAHIPLADMNATSGNTGWGWTDPLDGTEYAIMGLNNGTAFVDISDPENPIYLGKLPTHTGSSIWREFKVAGNYVYIVSDSNGNHGMQVFDLTLLRDVVSPPVTFSETAHYNNVASTHNIATNADTNFAYIVGGSVCSGTGGLHMVNIQNPLSPTFAGCFSGDGYTHDTQCVTYSGPDVDYQGDEICFSSNTDTLTIVDVTNKSLPVMVSRTGYAGYGYTHQGWLTEDQRYFLMDDELDESNFGHNTRTYIWDLADLEEPEMMGYYQGPTAAIDHNLYIRGRFAYESNYRAGLRILDISDVANASLSEVAYFDTYPGSNSAAFNGTWNNYPYFERCMVVVSDLDRGLFIVRPHLPGVDVQPDIANQVGIAGQTVTYTLTVENTSSFSDTFDLTLAGNNWVTAVSTNTLWLAAGDMADVLVTVAVPVAAAGGEMDMATLTAVSQSEPCVDSRTTLNTEAAFWAVTLGAAENAQDGAPATTVTYTVDITNTGNISDSYALSLSGQLWNATLSTSTLSLDAGESTAVTVQVEVPAEASAGSSDVVTVTAVGQTTSISDSVELTTTANTIYSVEATAADANQSGFPGTMLTYTVHVTNTGNAPDNYDLSLESDWTAVLSSNSLTLTQGTSGSVQIFVTIPPEAAVNDTDTITVIATSQNGVGVTAEVVLTAVALDAPAFHIYLPAILVEE
jgi:choice-of-anchor B domain-containing protein